MTDINRAASVTPPVIGGDTPNVWVIAGATSHAQVAVPSDWYGQYLTLHADGADFYVAFSESATAEVSPTATSTITSKAFSAQGTTVCEKIPDGGKLNIDLARLTAHRDQSKALYLVFEASATSSYLRITRSSGNAQL